MADRNDYALDTFGDIAKQDPMRLLDLGNDIQVGLGYLGAPTETERATSNFDKLVEGKSRPASHTVTDASRVVPDILTVILTLLTSGGGAAVKGAKQIPAASGKAVKAIWRKALERAAKKAPTNLIERKTAKGIGKKLAIKAADKLSDEHMKLGRAISDVITHSQGKSPRELQYFILDNLDALATRYGIDKAVLRKAAMRPDTYISHPKVYELGKAVADNDDFIKIVSGKVAPNNIEEFARTLTTTRHAAIKKASQDIVEHGMEGLGIDSAKTLKQVQKAASKAAKSDVPGIAGDAILQGLKTETKLGVGRGIESALKGAQDSQTNEKYAKEKDWQSHPVKDILKSIIGVDYTDPSRFVEDDIEGYWQFLQDNGFIEQQPGNISPRIKVQVITGINKDSGFKSTVRDAWKDQKMFYLK